MPDVMDQKLEQMLGYPDTGAPNDDLFVVDVMRQVRKDQHTRKMILFLFGGIGAVFGLIGAILLSDGIQHVLTETVTATAWFQVPLLVSGAAAFYAWCMNDDLSLGN